MPPDGAVFHQTVLQKYLLSGSDIIGGQDGHAAGASDLIRNRRRELIGTHRQPDQDGQPNCQRDHERVPPPRGKAPGMYRH